jgi:simple sugar transport system permease protein
MKGGPLARVAVFYAKGPGRAMQSSQSDHIKKAVAQRNKRPMGQRIADWIRDKPEGGIAIMFVVAQIGCIVAALMFPDQFRYLSQPNVTVIFKAMAPLGVMALGVGVLMIAGEYDLSVGMLFSFLSIVCATLTNAWSGDISADGASAVTPFLALAIVLALGALIGCVHASVTLRFAIPSFITTLGAMLFWRSATLFYHGAVALRYKPSEPFATIFGGQFLGVFSASILWFAVMSIAFYFLLHHHRIGNHFYAVGGNRNAAVAIGINPGRTKTIAFAIAGVMAAFSGVLAATRVGSIQPGGGQGMELQAIAACVIGGAALTGGRGSILGIVLGTALVFSIQDVLLLIRAPAYYFDGFVGALIVLAVIMNTAVRRQRA